MHSVKRLISFVMLPMLVCVAAAYVTAGIAAAAASDAKTFADVTDEHWAFSAVQDMIGQGIIDGYDDGSFRPGDSLTREQFAKLLTLALDEPLQPAAEATFSDVSPDSWSYPYVETVKPYLEGYVLPIGKPFFEPGAIATREDVAVALVKSMKLGTEGIDARAVIESSLSDYDDISPGLDVYVAVALQHRLIEGYPDGTFKPRDGLDRGAAATLLYRLLQFPEMPKLKEIELAVKAPDSAETLSIQLSGSVGKDTVLTMNGVDVPHNGSFTVPIYFSDGEGDYTFEFRAVKPNGRYKAVVKHMTFAIPAPKLTAESPTASDKQKVVVKGTVSDINDAGPVVRVNDEEVKVAANGTWNKEVLLNEGSNDIVITASNQYDKTAAMQKNVTFTVKPPELKVDDLPEKVNTKTLKITGRASDMNDPKPQLSLNGQTITSLDFALNVPLKEGSNTFVIEAKNSWGKTTKVTKQVNFDILPPEITLEPFMDTSLTDRVTIKGSATDVNDPEPNLYINERLVGKKSFSTELYLREGLNIFTFKATNNLGKTSTVAKKITYVILPPNLYVEPIPETSSSRTITVKASATDAIDRAPDLYLNNLLVGETSFTRTITLTEGMNTITFKATNELGKSTVIEKRVNFVPPPPAITVENLLETATSKTVSYKFSAFDPNDSYPKLLVNNQNVGFNSYNGSVTLKEGVNTIVFKATNSAGKSAEVTKTVIFEAPGPVITVDPLPETTATPYLLLTASAADPNDGNPRMYLNGQDAGTRSLVKSVTLTEGENIFVIKATNSFGKSTEVVKKVIYSSAGPTVTVGALPATTNMPTVMISASATDLLDPSPKLYLNGQFVQNGSFAKEVTLAAGVNKFEIKAVNKNGKTSNIATVSITYTPPAAAPEKK